MMFNQKGLDQKIIFLQNIGLLYVFNNFLETYFLEKNMVFILIYVVFLCFLQIFWIGIW